MHKNRSRNDVSAVMKKAVNVLFPCLFRASYIKDVYSIHFLGVQGIVSDTVFHLDK